ncbi:hypothetical protein ACFL47_10885 [Candidatus Latescibacterota bacterium]
MKRRYFLSIIISVSSTFLMLGCSRLGFHTGNSNTRQNLPSKGSQVPTRRTSRRRRSTRITDLKTLSKLLHQARRPLTNMQVEYLLTLKEGPEFTTKMMDILTESQKEALTNASGGRRRRR